jgi:hypothetical protein
MDMMHETSETPREIKVEVTHLNVMVISPSYAPVPTFILFQFILFLFFFSLNPTVVGVAAHTCI